MVTDSSWCGCRKGMDLYFKRHDGQAVTCDDFLAAMADANGQDLSTVARWSVPMNAESLPEPTQISMPLLATAGARGVSLLNVLSLAQRPCCPVALGFVANYLVAQSSHQDTCLCLLPQMRPLGAASRFMLMHKSCAAAYVVFKCPVKIDKL